MQIIVNGKTHSFKKEKVQAIGNFPNGGERFINMIYRFHKWEVENHSETTSEIILSGERFELQPKSKTTIHCNSTDVILKSKDKAYIKAIGHLFVRG